MLYFLECMLRVITATVAGMDGSMQTTGEQMTGADIAVGVLGWVAAAFIIIGIRLISRYRKKQKNKATTQTECEQNDEP